MISSIICIIKVASISWSEFTHIALPILIAEFILDEVLINVLPDILGRKAESNEIDG